MTEELNLRWWIVGKFSLVTLLGLLNLMYPHGSKNQILMRADEASHQQDNEGWLNDIHPFLTK